MGTPSTSPVFAPVSNTVKVKEPCSLKTKFLYDFLVQDKTITKGRIIETRVLDRPSTRDRRCVTEENWRKPLSFSFNSTPKEFSFRIPLPSLKEIKEGSRFSRVLSLKKGEVTFTFSFCVSAYVDFHRRGTRLSEHTFTRSVRTVSTSRRLPYTGRGPAVPSPSQEGFARPGVPRGHRRSDGLAPEVGSGEEGCFRVLYH